MLLGKVVNYSAQDHAFDFLDDDDDFEDSCILPVRSKASNKVIKTPISSSNSSLNTQSNAFSKSSTIIKAAIPLSNIVNEPIREQINNWDIYTDEGWILAKGTRHIGDYVRKILKDGSIVDSRVVAYLSTEANDGEPALYHTIDNDGSIYLCLSMLRLVYIHV
jgi:hypothetical protein